MHKNKLHLIVDVLAYLVMACLAGTGLLMYYRLPPGSGNLAILGYTRHDWGAVHFYLAIGLAALVALHVMLHWAWVRNSVGALLRPKDQREAGAGAGGAILLVVLGVVAAGTMAAPWFFPIGQGSGQGHGGGGGEGKGYRGGRSDAATEALATQGKAKQGGCSEETCDGTCPTDPAALAERHGKDQAEEHTGGGGQSGIKGSTTLAEAAAEGGVPVERLVAELKLPAGVSPAETLGRLRRQHGFTMEDIRAAVARLKKPKAANP